METSADVINAHGHSSIPARTRLRPWEIEQGRQLDFRWRRPLTREDCKHAPRPCPFVGCKYHLYLDVNPDTGTIKLNFPRLDPHEMRESCALGLAEQGGLTLLEVGQALNVSRERIRQIEVEAFTKLRDHPLILELLGPLGEGS